METKLMIYNKKLGKLERAFWLSANPLGGYFGSTYDDSDHALAISTGIFGKQLDGKQREYYSGDIVEVGSEDGKPAYDVVRYIQGEWEPICFYSDLKRVGTAFCQEDVNNYLGVK